ncbi:peptidoglycan DD-metalloendopeptidase family protein [Rubrobacter marinus]|uniref:Peptidoglycan DD-metalloendopeptidase family protein n=1 Tax=Rubrobacter marinus TaxID=2653852 RepID=A0A6G8PSK4_9ACTN|nr:M23 family metallopeptidase [Rubrobacter marinus]QIN77344.1 peptidoglycan DD-metalloendopeptidase family protein [Rubrobacter marinus]
MSRRNPGSGRWRYAGSAVLLALLAWLLLAGRRGGDTRPEPPLPPAARGRWAFQARYMASVLSMLFVPSMRRQAARQISGNSSAAARAVAEPAAYRQEARYSLPFRGEWYVYNGGPDEATSHSWDVVAQRYAYDFVMVDGSLRRWSRAGEHLEDYRCYGAPILAPADGLVVELRDGVRDAPGAGTGWVDLLTDDFRGNFVTIRHAEGEYGFLAHLIPGSVRVAVGERVKAGQEIGRCGNSGHSTEPHLHFHVQDRADFFQAAGLPVAFDGVSLDGEAPASRLYPRRGTRVRST